MCHMCVHRPSIRMRACLHGMHACVRARAWSSPTGHLRPNYAICKEMYGMMHSVFFVRTPSFNSLPLRGWHEILVVFHVSAPSANDT